MTATAVDPGHRRLIAVMTELDRADMIDGSVAGETFLRSDAIFVVTWPLDAAELASNPVLVRLDAVGLLERGAVLVQSPLDPDRYYHPADASGAVAGEKLLAIVKLCRLLGAETVEIGEISLERAGATASWSAKAAKQPIGGEASSAREELAQFVAGTHVRDTFVGSAPDLPAARAHLDRMRLSADESLSSLVDGRDGINPILSRTFRFTSAVEATKVTDRLAALSVAPVSLRGQLHHDEEHRSVYTFDLDVAFPRAPVHPPFT
jgi:hypothetical protein